MNDKQQLQAMGCELRLTDDQGKRLAEAIPPRCNDLVLLDDVADMATRLQECAQCAAKMQEQRDRLAAELAKAKAEARKYKLAGLGMAVSMGEHVCVQEGWQAVPVVPTPEMLDEGNRALAYDCCSGTADEAWSAMLDAAPKPQGGE